MITDDIREINPVNARRTVAHGGGRQALLADLRAYPLDDIAEALALMRSNQHFGKIVISIG